MKTLLSVAMLALLTFPSESSAQSFWYAYRNTPFGQAYTYRVQNGPFAFQTQGFRPYMPAYPSYPVYPSYPYGPNPYYAFQQANYPFLGFPNTPFPIIQQASPVIIQQPIVINQNPAAVQQNPFGLAVGGNQPPVQNIGGGLIIPPDVKPMAKIDAPKQLPIPKVGAAPRVVAKAPIEPAAKVEMPKVANQPGGLELAKRAVESGRNALAHAEYGRALELFRKAAEQNPNDPITYYLLAQTQIAVGKYREAVSSISAGMMLKADWSASKFQPRNLHGENEKVFDEQITQLRAALAEFPDDPTLNFLLGHQLWFDNKKEDAKPLLAKAKAGTKGASPAEQFLIP